MNPGQDATSPTAAAGVWGSTPPATPARGAEGASPAGNATGGVPAFQPGFVLGVALFLALTGGVKLTAVLQESRLLGAADPLLPWLTTRQMLFAAAGLELGVAAAVFRHRAARWAPWLILWLAGVFGAYRWGLRAVGFEGHCPCLGHLFARWPEFEVGAGRLMLASLAVMGLGSVVCLACSAKALPNRPLNVGVFPVMLLLLLTPGASQAKRCVAIDHVAAQTWCAAEILGLVSARVHSIYIKSASILCLILAMCLWPATARAQVEFTGEIVEINTIPGMGTIRLDWHAKGWLQEKKWKLQITPHRHEIIEKLHDDFMLIVGQITNQPTLSGGGDLDDYYYRIGHEQTKQSGETSVSEIGRGRGLIPGGTHELLPAAWLGWFAAHFALKQEPGKVPVRGLWFRHDVDANAKIESLLSDALLFYDRAFNAEILPFHFTVAETDARSPAKFQHFLTGGHRSEVSIKDKMNTGEVILQKCTTVESFIGGGKSPYRRRTFVLKNFDGSPDFDVRPVFNGKFFYTDYSHLDRELRVVVQMMGKDRWPEPDVIEAAYRDHIARAKPRGFSFLPQIVIAAILLVTLTLWLARRSRFTVKTKQPSLDHDHDKI